MRTYYVEYVEDEGDYTTRYTDIVADTFTICNENNELYVMFFEFPPDDDGEMSPVAMIPYDRIISINSQTEVNKEEGDSE